MIFGFPPSGLPSTRKGFQYRRVLPPPPGGLFLFFPSQEQQQADVYAAHWGPRTRSEWAPVLLGLIVSRLILKPAGRFANGRQLCPS